MGKKTKPRTAKKMLQRRKSAHKKTHPPRDNSSQNILLQNAFSLYHQGNAFGAEKLFHTLLNTRSKDPGFINQLGVLAHMLGKSAIGLNYLHKSVDLHPAAPLYNNLGLVQEQLGDLDGARNSYEQAITLDPNFSLAHYNLGNTLQKKSKYQDAVESYYHAIQLRQDYAAAYCNLAHAQKMLEELDEAETSCLAALKIQPDYAEAISIWCNIMLQKENPEKVLASCEEALDFVQKKDLVYATLGDNLSDIGNKQEALIAYRNALLFSTRPGKIYLRMAMLNKFKSHDNDLQNMEKSYERATDQNDKAYICFAIGKAYEDLEKYQEAFQYIEEGNRLARDGYTYSVDEDRVFFQQLRSVFDSNIIQQTTGYGYKSSRPIFVVGMPRSGTTLVEQLLASHSQVYGAGELTELDTLMHKTLLHDETKDFPGGIKKLERRQFDLIGVEYVSSLKKYLTTAEKIVDKSPHNFFWLGLIHIALPEAKIIHCKRDPMDTCWSIYKNIFNVPHKYAQDLVELGQYYKLYLDLMDHWKRIIPHGFYEIEYEELIKNQETETRKLLDYCNLSWEDSCLDFHTSERRIVTSSMAQVRNPIYSSSINKWKYFEKELKPLSDILNKGRVRKSSLS